MFAYLSSHNISESPIVDNRLLLQREISCAPLTRARHNDSSSEMRFSPVLPVNLKILQKPYCTSCYSCSKCVCVPIIGYEFFRTTRDKMIAAYVPDNAYVSLVQ